jgi:hypothetical protein
VWKHRHNHNVIVSIVKSPRGYLIYHSHPAPHGAIMQEPEGAMNMKNARERAEKHLLHWSDISLWKQDRDYGKIGIRGA